MWAATALGGGIVVSALEAYLLDRKKGFFTGGFLADQILDTIGERVAFGLGSLLADVGAIAALAGCLFFLTRRLRWGLTTTWTLTSTAAAAVLVIGDVIQFQLDRFIGLDVDLALLFDLTGRSVSEFVAVAAGHLATPLVVIGCIAAAVGVLGWRTASRNAARGASRPEPVGLVRPGAALACSVLAVSALRLASPDADDALRRKPSVMWTGDLIDVATDVDRDGFGLLGRPVDPAPLDSRVYPYALDFPDNGIDENGLLGDLPAGTPPYVEPLRPAPWRSRRHIVLVMLESVRADAIGARLNGRPVTPVLDGLAQQGVASGRAWSHNGYTVQSRHHLLTGTLANVGDGTSLIDDFLASGYAVGYVSAQDDSFGSAALDAGFRRASYVYTARDEPDRRYTRFATPGSLAIPLDIVEEKVQDFLSSRDPARPVFLYVNFHDTHFPYHHRGLRPLVNEEPLPQADIAPRHQARLRATYLNAVANVDAAIGRVLASVRESVDGEVGIIVVSDHGESLYDEGFLGHGYALDEAQTRIPLVVANVPMTIEEPWGQVQLRRALGAALQQDPGGPVQPTVTDSGTGVFQYLGGLARPREIAYRSASQFVAYDVRRRRVLRELRERGAQRSNDRAGVEVMALVHLWERMRLASARKSAE